MSLEKDMNCDKEFDDIKKIEKSLYKHGVDKTPSQNIAYQLGWSHLLCNEADEEKESK
jgi:hypothetical protein